MCFHQALASGKWCGYVGSGGRGIGLESGTSVVREAPRFLLSGNPVFRRLYDGEPLSSCDISKLGGKVIILAVHPSEYVIQTLETEMHKVMFGCSDHFNYLKEISAPFNLMRMVGKGNARHPKDPSKKDIYGFALYGVFFPFSVLSS